MAFDSTDVYDSANDRIAAWSKDRFAELKSEIVKQGIRHIKRSNSPKAAVSSLKKSLRKNGGLINRIGYGMPRHMIYVHKGVGKGTTIAQAGSTNRKAKPWYNPVIDRSIDELADIVAEELGSSIINRILIK